MAYANAPNEVLSTLSAMMDKENSESGSSSVIESWSCWDNQIKALLIEKLESTPLKEFAGSRVAGGFAVPRRS